MKINKIKCHIAAWGCYIILFLIVDFLFEQKGFNIVKEAIVFIIEIWIFYSFVAAFLISRKFKNKFIFLILFLIVSFIITIFLNYFRNRIAIYYGSKWIYSYLELFMDTFSFYLQFAIYAIGYLFFTFSYQRLIKIKILETEKLNTEKQLLELISKNALLQKNLFQSENDFLRAQINPHFLHNCLNYFYAETMEVAPRVGDGIVLLSEIMRYSITDFTATNGLARLENELENIENVIQLNNFRFENALYIKFDVVGDAANKYITPMILISLVENMFKHGDLQDETNPALIHCTIEETTEKIIFTTSNKCNKSKVVIPGGLGTGNIIKRLDLLYENNYTLAFEEQVSIYTSKLVIPYYDTYIKKIGA